MKLKKDYKGDVDYMAGVVKLEDYMKDLDVYGLLYDEPTPEDYIKDGKEMEKMEVAIELHKNGASDELIINSLHITEEELEEYLKGE